MTEDQQPVTDGVGFDYQRIEAIVGNLTIAVGELANTVAESKALLSDSGDKQDVQQADDQTKRLTDYQVTVEMIKLLSDIRFRCLAFVTTIVGVATALLPNNVDSVNRIPVGMIGFLATLGIAVYELRNSQLYEAAIHRAKELEADLGLERSTEHSQQGGLFNERPRYVENCRTPKEWEKLKCRRNKTDDLFTDDLFTEDDLKDVIDLLHKLQDKRNSLSQHIWNSLQLKHQLPPDTDWPALTDEEKRSVVAAVVVDLNNLLQRDSLYTPDLFKKVRLRAKTWNLIQQNPQDKKRKHLNRLLLEDAYPEQFHAKETLLMSFWRVPVKHDRGLALIYSATLGGWVYLITDGLLSLSTLKHWPHSLDDWIPIIPALLTVLAGFFSAKWFIEHDDTRFRPSAPQQQNASSQSTAPLQQNGDVSTSKSPSGEALSEKVEGGDGTVQTISSKLTSAPCDMQKHGDHA